MQRYFKQKFAEDIWHGIPGNTFVDHNLLYDFFTSVFYRNFLKSEILH